MWEVPEMGGQGSQHGMERLGVLTMAILPEEKLGVGQAGEAQGSLFLVGWRHAVENLDGALGLEPLDEAFGRLQWAGGWCVSQHETRTSTDATHAVFAVDKELQVIVLGEQQAVLGDGYSDAASRLDEGRCGGCRESADLANESVVEVDGGHIQNRAQFKNDVGAEGLKVGEREGGAVDGIVGWPRPVRHRLVGRDWMPGRGGWGHRPAGLGAGQTIGLKVWWGSKKMTFPRLAVFHE